MDNPNDYHSYYFIKITFGGILWKKELELF